jgi:uncharacterized membrane protein
MVETRRRTLVKTVTWRVIGIFWTWLGAYLILVSVPDRFRTAAVVSTLIVVYHHSTRMVMYYAYERIWAGVAWGKSGEEGEPPLPWRLRLVWGAGLVLALAVVLFLVLYVTPLVKPS